MTEPSQTGTLVAEFACDLSGFFQAKVSLQVAFLCKNESVLTALPWLFFEQEERMAKSFVYHACSI